MKIVHLFATSFSNQFLLYLSVASGTFSSTGFSSDSSTFCWYHIHKKARGVALGSSHYTSFPPQSIRRSSFMLAVLLYLQAAAAVLISLCSPQNLGTNSATYQFMSNGWCSDYCRSAGYAAAITQNYNCWCSNAVPADTVPNTSCSNNCPGYSEKCGGPGVFGYIVLSSVSTVSSGSSSTSSLVGSSSDGSSSLSQSSLNQSSQSSSGVSSPSPLILSSQASSSSSTSRSSSGLSRASNQQSSQTPLVSTAVYATTVVSIQTVGGSSSELVSTKYITEIATPTSTSAPPPSNKSSFFDSTAKVAGTFTAVGVVAVAFAATLIYCCCFAGGQHRDTYSDEENQSSSDESFAAPEKRPPPRSSSEHSKASLMGSNGNIKRNSSSKSVLSLLNLTSGTGGSNASNIHRSSSKKKLNPRNENIDMGGPIMFPISEFENVLDSSKIFSNSNQSRPSFADETDYSRRILHVANP